MKKTLSILWSLALIGVGIWFFLIPCGITGYYLATDEGLREPGGSAFAFDWHRKLSVRYQNYAERRVESGVAAHMSTADIAGTEWPLFGSVFYLWATVQLQKSWEKDNSLSKVAPKEYARGAIEAATVLVLDENHAAWVKDHWGEEDYLKRENVFYRMLMMSAIIAHHELTGSAAHLDVLRGQVESFTHELDASAHGLLDDYPQQCYPTDVVAALAAVKRADRILGTDHGELLARSIRGFEGALAGPFGLPPYAANAATGVALDASRGCGNSYFCSFGPEVWPGRAAGWYRAYVDKFWQTNWFAAGFREFPDGFGQEWYFDVDAGPVIGGFGSAASAFGVAAARTNGDFERAYSMSAEMLAMSWPLANGTLLLPRLVSDRKHAPLLGEMAILFQLSREPVATTSATEGTGWRAIPGCVWLVLGMQLLLGAFIVSRGTKRLRKMAKAGRGE